MNPRTPIADLKLSGSPNLARALKREKNDLDRPPLTQKQQTELEQIDALIMQCLKCCKRGQTRRGRRNPAFANLDALTKVRQRILARREPQESGADILDEIDRAMSGAKN